MVFVGFVLNRATRSRESAAKWRKRLENLAGGRYDRREGGATNAARSPSAVMFLAAARLACDTRLVPDGTIGFLTGLIAGQTQIHQATVIETG